MRRFLLRFAVGLLAFLLGVTAVWALGHFNPFQNSSGTRYYQHKRCGSYRSWSATPEPGVVYPVYREHGCRTKRDPGELLPPPPPPPARRQFANKDRTPTVLS